MGKEQLKIEDLHPVLQYVYEIGAEIRLGVASCIKKERDIGRTALNLTDAVEENPSKVDYYEYWTDSDTGRKMKTPVYAKEHRWRVNFSVENEGRLSSGMSIALHSVQDIRAGLQELEVIARDLQRIYDLPYVPAVYRDGKSARGVTA